MVTALALPLDRPPPPLASSTRTPMAMSLGLHGAAILLLFAAGTAGGSGAEEPALFVELALAGPSSFEATGPDREDAAPAAPIDLPPAEEAPPVDLSALQPLAIVPSPEPPPLDPSTLGPVPAPAPIQVAASPAPPPVATTDLKPPVAPGPAAAPRRQQQGPAVKQASAKAPASDGASEGGTARQAAAGFLPASPIVWEGKPRFRHPPQPAAYPPRAVELNQQGEVLVRVRLDTDGTAVEILLHRPSGYPLLDRAALAAVRGWHFLPAMRDGRAVPAWVEIPVRFHLR